MKKLMTVLMFALLSTNANALFLQNCYNHTFGNEAVSYSYQSCINSNFREIERNVDGALFLQYCSNFGNEVQYSFTSCINRNFQEVERKLDQPVFLSFCSNFSRDRLDFSFESCVRRNYSEVERNIQN